MMYVVFVDWAQAYIETKYFVSYSFDSINEAHELKKGPFLTLCFVTFYDLGPCSPMILEH